MSQKHILIIHPYDKTTTFLDRIKNHLQYNFKKDVHYFSIKPNETSHDICIDNIRNLSPKGFIIFIGHGRSDKLYGSKGDDYSSFISSIPLSEISEQYYYNDNFINETNVQVFKEKKVFCLTCNSNDKIGKLAVERGARAFLGFGDIPTSLFEFEEKGVKVGENVISFMKTELNYIIKTALEYCIKKNSSFEDLQNIITFLANQRITSILINQKSFKERYILTDYLYYLKKEIIIYGDKTLKLLE